MYNRRVRSLELVAVCALLQLLDEVIYMSRVVRLFPQDVCARSNPLQQSLPLLPPAHLYALLNHVVPILVLHHLKQRPIQIVPAVLKLQQNLLNYRPPILVTPILQTLLNHVARKFMVRIIYHLKIVKIKIKLHSP